MESKIQEVNDILSEKELSVEVINAFKDGKSLPGYAVHGRRKVSPVLYFSKEDLNRPASDIASYLAGVYEDVSFDDTSVDILGTPEYVLEHVYPVLISKTHKEDLKKSNIVCKDYLDMCIYFRVNVDFMSSEEVTSSFKLTWEHLRKCELLIDKVLAYSLKNLRKTAVIKHLSDIIKKYGIDISDDEEFPMWVATTESSLNGAAVMLLDNVLSDLSDRLGDSYIILPSSVHEIIAVPMLGECTDLFQFLNMVREVNSTVVEENDILSNSIYVYEDGKVRMWNK